MVKGGSRLLLLTVQRNGNMGPFFKRKMLFAQIDWKKSQLPPLRIDVRKRCLLMCCAGISFVLVLVLTELFLAPDLSLYQLIAYAPTAQYFFITGCVWGTFAHCLKDASVQLSHALHQVRVLFARGRPQISC